MVKHVVAINPYGAGAEGVRDTKSSVQVGGMDS